MSKTQRTWIIASVSVVVIVALVLVVMSVRGQGTSTSATYQTTTVQLGTLTSTVEGTGTVASTQSVNLSWLTSGQVDQVLAQIGDQVKAGDVLATQLRDTKTTNSLLSELVTAQENLAELTSPEAIANAKLAITTAEADVINAQYGVNNLKYWKNDGLIQNYYAKLVLAQDNLDKAQTAYDNAKVGQYINNSSEALAYENLYAAQQLYNTAKYNYSVLPRSRPSDISMKPRQLWIWRMPPWRRLKPTWQH